MLGRTVFFDPPLAETSGTWDESQLARGVLLSSLSFSLRLINLGHAQTRAFLLIDGSKYGTLDVMLTT